MTSPTKMPSPDDRNKVINDIRKACEVLEAGGVIIYPTDTVWGIGCDATNPDAVRKIYDIKQRDDSKALITLVGSTAWIERYVEDVPEIVWDLLDVAVKPLTVIYDHGRNLAPNLLASDGSIGLRVTNEFYSSELCKRFRRPIVSTSANISGSPTPESFCEISPDILKRADFIASWRRDDTEPASPSAIIKIGKGGTVKILR